MIIFHWPFFRYRSVEVKMPALHYLDIMQIIIFPFFFFSVSCVKSFLKNSAAPLVDGPTTEELVLKVQRSSYLNVHPLLLHHEFTATHWHDNMKRAVESSTILLNLEQSDWQVSGKCPSVRGSMFRKT